MKKIALFSLLLCGILASGTGYSADAQMCSGVSCFSYPNGGDVNRICEDNNLKKGNVCTTTGATKAVCMDDVSCAAKECDDNHILWLTDLSPKKTNRWQSQGRCVERAWLQQRCDNNCGRCPDGQKCVIADMDNTSAINVNNNGSYQGKAFYGKHACECRPIQGQPQSEETCDVFTNVTCSDGKISGHKKIGTLKKADIFDQDNKNPISCPDFESKINDNTLFVKTADGQTKNLRDVINEMMLQFCKKPTTGGETVVDSATNAQNAHSRLQAFFNSKADVWKDAEGKFNTARLASDLTAGVVLGTVGGVVSGVVIKKKQVEKGFDALHCTVGGQTVADWGDEFIVGISK